MINSPVVRTSVMLAILGAATLMPTPAVARAGGSYVESITSDAVVCRTTTTDGRFRVQGRVYQDSTRTNFTHVQVSENHGDINLVVEGYGQSAWAAGEVRGTGSLWDAQGLPVGGEAYLASRRPRCGPSPDHPDRADGRRRLR